MNSTHSKKRSSLGAKLLTMVFFISAASGCQTASNRQSSGQPSATIIHSSNNTKHQSAPFRSDPIAAETGSFICHNAPRWRGQVVGDGHCVSLIKRCSGAPNTDQWRAGPLVKGLDLQPGTIIATFHRGRYPSRTGYHAAIYSHQDDDGIWVWDQWLGKPVYQRLIRWHQKSATAANRGTRYRVVVDPNNN